MPASGCTTTVDAADDGPLKDRMSDHRRPARRRAGRDVVDRTSRRPDRQDHPPPRSDRTPLEGGHRSTARLTAAPSDDVESALASVRSQLESTERLQAESAKTADRLRLTQTRLDELVTRAAEVAIGAGDTDAYEHDVDDLVIELEALRQAVEEINRP